MSAAGGALSGGAPRTSTTRSTLLESLGTQPSMRRALARLGAGLNADGPATLLSQHLYPGGLLQTMGLFGVSTRHQLFGRSGGSGSFGGSALLAPPRAAAGRAGNAPAGGYEGSPAPSSGGGGGGGAPASAGDGRPVARGRSRRTTSGLDGAEPKQGWGGASSAAAASSSGALSQQLDRSMLEQKRLQGEAARLRKNYDAPDPQAVMLQVARALADSPPAERQAALQAVAAGAHTLPLLPRTPLPAPVAGATDPYNSYSHSYSQQHYPQQQQQHYLYGQHYGQHPQQPYGFPPALPPGDPANLQQQPGAAAAHGTNGWAVQQQSPGLYTDPQYQYPGYHSYATAAHPDPYGQQQQQQQPLVAAGAVPPPPYAMAEEALSNSAAAVSPTAAAAAAALAGGSGGSGAASGLDGAGGLLGGRRRKARETVEAVVEAQVAAAQVQAQAQASPVSPPPPSPTPPPKPKQQQQQQQVQVNAQQWPVAPQVEPHVAQPPPGWPAEGPYAQPYHPAYPQQDPQHYVHQHQPYDVHGQPYGSQPQFWAAPSGLSPGEQQAALDAALAAQAARLEQEAAHAAAAAAAAAQAAEAEAAAQAAQAVAEAEAAQPAKKVRAKRKKKAADLAAAENPAAAAAAAAAATSSAAATAAEEVVAAPAKPKRASRKTAAATVSADGGGAAAATPAAATSGRGAAAVAARSATAAATAPYLEDYVNLPPAAPQRLEEWPDFFWAADGYATRQPLQAAPPDDVLIVDTPEVARAVVQRLMSVADRPYPGAANRTNPPVPCRYFACDTEVAFIDVTSETPVGHGAVLCFSVYGGDDLDFADLEQLKYSRSTSSMAAATPAAAWHGSAGAAGAAGAAGPVFGSPQQEGGLGQGQGRKDRLWVDVWAEVELGPDGRPLMDGRYVRLKPHHPILSEFKRFFEDAGVKKVWHNYGFDRHVLENMGIACAGFGGDTLHMARLADASRSGKKTYGLDSLTSDRDIMRFFTPMSMEPAPRERTGHRRRGAAAAAAAAGGGYGPPGLLGPAGAAGAGAGAAGGTWLGSSPGAKEEARVRDMVRAKLGMKERFGMYKLRADGPAKVPELPPIQRLHDHPRFRPTWIDYSALDAKATWQLREALEAKLRAERWEMERSLAKQLGYDTDLLQKQAAAAAAAAQQAGAAAGPAAVPAAGQQFLHLWHFYCAYWLDFGELLTEMERRGMMVNREHLRQAQVKAEADRAAAVKEFLDWADSKVPGARYMNPGSGSQIRMLLFPDYPGVATKAAAEAANKAKAAAARAASRTAGRGGGNGPSAAAAAEEGSGGAEGGAKPLGGAEGGSRIIKVLNPNYEAEKAAGLKVSRYMDVELHGIWGRGVPGRLQPEALTATNAAAVSIRVLRGLAGKPGAARKELTALLERRAAAAAADEEARAVAAAAAQRAAATAVPIVEDEEDDALAAVQGVEGGVEGGGLGEEEEVRVVSRTADGRLLGAVPVVDDAAALAALQKEADDKKLGRLYVACGGGEEGLRACVAIEALCEVNAIDKLLSAFIIPLQSDDTSTTTWLPLPGADQPADQQPQTQTQQQQAPQTQTQVFRPVHRVHCSLNINTETGRLSARRPNLQNQPALEKDRYKVRQAFTADVAAGHTLVVADYGQLELRLLAHMTDCKSMLEAFVLGGDFHSRTAVGMYDHIKDAIRENKVLLEWDGEGESPLPLVKDLYASERRKAKVLNFSIAYGKTAHGLAADFKTSKEEAQATVDKWYADRFEVRQWQEATKEGARQEGKVRTLLGRTRPLPGINAPDFKSKGHSERAAINTPIQGSAADVAAAAMVAIAKSAELRATGFKLLMQIHDEVILEGPKANADAAKRLVMSLMANPWRELARHWNAPPPPLSSSSPAAAAAQLPAGGSAGTGADGGGGEGGVRHLASGEGWVRPAPALPGGHLAGTWRWDDQPAQEQQMMMVEGVAGGAEAGGVGGAAEGAPEGEGGQPAPHAKKVHEVMPLLVELATDCNVADTWYEAK